MIDSVAANSDSSNYPNPPDTADHSDGLGEEKGGDIPVEQILKNIDDAFHKLSDSGKEKTTYVDILEQHLPRLFDEAPKYIFPKEALSNLIEYASFLLSIGSYELCVKLCHCVLSSRSESPVSSVDRLKTLFLQAKAYRNSGEYPLALQTLHLALEMIDADESMAYTKGAALLRIGKVYSEYLMMMRVSIHFLTEAESELSKWLDDANGTIRAKANSEYAICLDSIGQYWSRRENYKEAILYFNKAENVNRSLGRQSGIRRNQAHRTVARMKQLDLTDPSSAAAQSSLIREMQGIIRALLNDPKNEKGAGVRYAQLAEMYFVTKNEADARSALAESRRIASRYGDNKTLARAETIELKYLSDPVYGNLREVTSLLKQLNYSHYQISVNDLAISAINDGRLSNYNAIDNVIYYLQDNRAIYLKLSKIAKDTILTISDETTRSEFSHLTSRDRFSLLREIIGDYDWFINKMNEIIDKLISISKKRSDSLNIAVISEAKASLASSVLHDFKHIVATSASGEITGTILDPILEILRSGAEITPDVRQKLIDSISDTNDKLKTSILPRINEATRVPRNFQELINVREVFLNISSQKPEEYQSIREAVTVDCDESIQILYNYDMFATLFKELLRNAIDYQRKNDLAVQGYVLKAEINEIGIITLSVLTDFQEEKDAENARNAIHSHLSGSDRDYGYGLKILNVFVLNKTRSSYFPTVAGKGRQAGISFKVPIFDSRNTAEERKQPL